MRSMITDRFAVSVGFSVYAIKVVEFNSKTWHVSVYDVATKHDARNTVSFNALHSALNYIRTELTTEVRL